ncbi:MAG: TIGR03960 family B12-binding radical SAM protein [Desulfamplus sp.]|nr:TIGR03960 family B12-binding radical SAM protein [Desulfamplus sp.]
MDKINIQEILPFVEMPSRYLGCEANSIKKDLSKVDLKFALAFPDLYEIGTSHFGMQILYTILNQQENIAAERFFTPAPDMEKILREKNTHLFSLESEIALKSFDIVGFSLLYELNFTNILTMLNLAGIPFHAKDRELFSDIAITKSVDSKNADSNNLNSTICSFPLIIAGGPCAFNPEPLADFFDAFVIGDGEKAVLEIAQAFIKWKDEKNRSKNQTNNSEKKIGVCDKKSLLKMLSKIDGVYVPSFFKPIYKPAKSDQTKLIQHLEPIYPEYTRIKRAILPDISTEPFPTSPVVPFGKPVHDRLRLEIARGCSRGCRFCQAGMIYRPVRERSVNELVEIAKESLKNTGYSDLSLLSLSTGDYSNLAELMEELMAINTGHCISISLPSVRAGKLTSPLMKIIKKVKKTGFTIAPEAGSQRLRDVINKNITEEDIFTTVKSAFELGWRNIKLYFMNGLPTETIEDIQAIADMAKRLAKIKTTGKGNSTINISFASFIPKAHTPFERCSQIHPDKAMENLNFLRQTLRHPGINIKWQHPKMSLLEGVWARGDRRLSSVLVKAWEVGCRLDGWSDMFRFDLWEQAFDECGVDPYFYTTRERAKDEVLPWSHIDCGISDKFIRDEFDKAMASELTQDCREHGCIGCGICDFKKIQPILFKSNADTTSQVQEPENIEHSQMPDNDLQSRKENPIKFKYLDNKKNVENNGNYSKLTIFYSKLGKAKHFGHLELAKIIRRAIRRAGLEVKYSTGFSPVMKISFDNPLPVGMESEEEFFSIQVNLSDQVNILEQSTLSENRPAASQQSFIKPDDIVKKLNDVLPRTITITRSVYSKDLKKNSDVNKANPDVNKDIREENQKETNLSISYQIRLKNFSITEQDIDEFMTLSEYVVDKLSFKGIQRTTDLRKVTEKIKLISSGNTKIKTKQEESNVKHKDGLITKDKDGLTAKDKDDLAVELDYTQLEMTLKNDLQRTIRPSEILTEVFKVPDNVLRSADIVKLKSA